MAVLIHGIHSSLNATMWNTRKMELSFDKLYKRIQERAFSLLQNMLLTVATAVKHFFREINRLAIACIKTRQPSRKTTLELLEDTHALSLS
jgi:antitoxin component of RelBE/YafQ-DinJ toxin-antitoxin module